MPEVTTSPTKQRVVKPQTAKSEREMTAGMQAIKFDPADLTVVTKKHPLAEKLYLNRNDTEYQAGSPSVEEFKRQGQLQPIGLFPYTNPNTGHKELVVAFGVQRRNKALAGGMQVEGVVFRDWTPEDAEQAMIAENEQRINLSFKDQLMAVKRLVKFHKEAKTKNYFGHVASLFNKTSHQWARDMYAVSHLPPKVLNKIPDVIPFATAIQIAKAEPIEGQKIEEAQLSAFDELMADETTLSQKGTVRAEKALNNRVGKKTVDKLSAIELRVIITDDKLDLSLSDEDTRVLISALLGDRDVNEVQRYGIKWYKHAEKKAKAPKKAKPAKEEQVNIDELEFDSDDDDDDE
jgi:hypothetical protein